MKKPDILLEIEKNTEDIVKLTSDLAENIQQLSGLNNDVLALETEKATKIEVEVERQRINSFIALEQGSTTGDAELVDARIGINGVIYPNLGEANREQFRNVESVLDIDNYADSNYLNYSGEYPTYYIANDGKMYALSTPNKDLFIIKEYQVTKYKTYNLKGTNVALLGNFPIAGFKITSGTSGALTIIQQGLTLETDYDITYTPIVDGYIFIAEIIDKNKLKPYNTVKKSSVIEDIKNKIPASWLYGKTWVAYGDSITAGYGLENHGTEPTANNLANSYAKRIADKNSMTFYNYGTSGRGYSVGGNYKLIDTLNTYGKIAEADIVTIAMGTNDYGVTAEIISFGDITDTTISETFVGYVKRTISKVQQLYPDSVIVVFTPIVRPGLLTKNVQGKTLIDYSDMIEDIAISYGCYVGDVLSKCRFNMESSKWKDTYMTDRLHPTQACVDKYLVPIFEKEMLNAAIN